MKVNFLLILVYIRLIENSEDNLSEIQNYTQVKLSKGFGDYEFFLTNKKDLSSKFMRLAVEYPSNI